jgi:transposase
MSKLKPRGESSETSSERGTARRRYTKEFKEEAVQMLLDGHAARSIAERLGLPNANMLYTWKRSLIGKAGATAVSLESRVRELESELRRVERERDVLKKALAIFGRDA